MNAPNADQQRAMARNLASGLGVARTGARHRGKRYVLLEDPVVGCLSGGVYPAEPRSAWPAGFGPVAEVGPEDDAAAVAAVGHAVAAARGITDPAALSVLADFYSRLVARESAEAARGLTPRGTQGRFFGDDVPGGA